MNTKQKLKEIIINYKDNKPFDVVINQMVSLYFEIEDQENKDPKPQIKLSDFVLDKDDLITEQSLFSLGFSKQFGIKNQYLCDSPKIRISLKMKNNTIYILNIDFKCLDYNDFLIENLEIKSIKEFTTILIILSNTKL